MKTRNGDIDLQTSTSRSETQAQDRLFWVRVTNLYCSSFYSSLLLYAASGMSHIHIYSSKSDMPSGLASILFNTSSGMSFPWLSLTYIYVISLQYTIWWETHVVCKRHSCARLQVADISHGVSMEYTVSWRHYRCEISMPSTAPCILSMSFLMLY